MLPLVAFGRSVRQRSRSAQDTLAEASAYAQEIIGGVRTVQAFTHEAIAGNRYRAAVEKAFQAARGQMRARGVLTFVAIFLIFASVVAVLWIGAQDVLAGRMSPGTLGQFVLYAVFAAGALGELSQVWGEIAQAAGATERLMELIAIEPAVKAPPRPAALPFPAKGTVAFEDVAFAYPSRPDLPSLRGVSFRVNAGRRSRSSVPPGRGRPRCSS